MRGFIAFFPSDHDSVLFPTPLGKGNTSKREDVVGSEDNHLERQAEAALDVGRGPRHCK